MNNWNRNRGKRQEAIHDPATNPAPKPGDYPVGSVESRAAARAMIKGKRKVVIEIQNVRSGPEPGSIEVVSTEYIELDDPR
jgi:hypothetical protein